MATCFIFLQMRWVATLLPIGSLIRKVHSLLIHALHKFTRPVSQSQEIINRSLHLCLSHFVMMEKFGYLKRKMTNASHRIFRKMNGIISWKGVTRHLVTSFHAILHPALLKKGAMQAMV